VNNLQFTGDDFFADNNVCSTVLEVPNYDLGPGEVGLWFRTLVATDEAGDGWVQANRGGRPAQLFLVLGLGDAERDAYLAGEPADAGRYVAGFAHALEHTGGYTPEEARRVARTRLPDLLSFARLFAERRAYPVLRCCLVYELNRAPHSKATLHDSAVRSLQTRCHVNLAASLLFLDSNEQRGLHLRDAGCRVMR